MLNEYKFKGWGWIELAYCWGLNADPVTPDYAKSWSGDFTVSDRIDVTYIINNMRMVFTIDDEEEVLSEKIKRRIWSNFDMSKAEFKNKQMRVDMENFLKALIEESERELGGDFNSPVYKGMLEVESDHAFAKWFTRNLEYLWS